MKHVIIVGGGIVGLSAAWFLRQSGAEVTVLERNIIGSGASWGNAGWVSPAFSVPLAEPSALKLGLSTLFSRTSPVSVPLQADLNLFRFLTRFASNCRDDIWNEGLRKLAPVNSQALVAYQEMERGGVEHGPTRMDPGLIFAPDSGSLSGLNHELAAVQSSGQQVEYDVLSGGEARKLAPMVSDEMHAALRLNNQFYLDPRLFVQSLAAKLVEQGVSIQEGVSVVDIASASRPVVHTGDGSRSADAVVVANGVWLAKFRKKLGVRQPIQAGRGYSFSVKTNSLPAGPLYFPSYRVVATPMSGTLRISGMMEFRNADAPLDRKRLNSLVRTVQPLLPSIDFSEISEVWVGSRPCTADGLPLIGESQLSGVYVAGGYGMWGVTLGPIGGKLLAQQITGVPDPIATPFNPLR